MPIHGMKKKRFEKTPEKLNKIEIKDKLPFKTTFQSNLHKSKRVRSKRTSANAGKITMAWSKDLLPSQYL